MLNRCLVSLLAVVPLVGCLTLDGMNHAPGKLHKLRIATGCADARYVDWEGHQGIAEGCGARWTCHNEYHYGVLLVREDAAVCRELEPAPTGIASTGVAPSAVDPDQVAGR